MLAKQREEDLKEGQLPLCIPRGWRRFGNVEKTGLPDHSELNHTPFY